MVPDYIVRILNKRNKNQYLTEQEKEQLREWLHSIQPEAIFPDEDWEKDFALYLQFDANNNRMDNSLKRLYSATGFMDEPVAEINSSKIGNVTPYHRVHFLRKWIWAAASVVLLLGFGIYLWTMSNKNATFYTRRLKAADVPPGTNGAILTLADGSQVVLDSLGDGVIANQNGVKVVLKNGGLSYAHGEVASGEIVYNTMSTPKGRQFQVILPDGTKVWLNAASTIRYPTVFTGKERKVDVTGEVYFEVVKKAGLPFLVKINDATSIEVLGTSFNVNSYPNEEAIRTTLVEGSVRITAYQQSQTIKPGQQAIVASSQQLNVVDKADIGKTLAWKNGLFNFDNMRLPEVMKQLERWYDIEVVYENGVPDVGFFGELDRNVGLNAILDVLKESGIHYRIEGRKLIVAR